MDAYEQHDADAAAGGDGQTMIAEPRPRRRFTLAEARRTLPLVSRIAADVSRAYVEARGVHAALAERPPRDRRAELEADLDRAVNRLHGYVDELTDLGVELKDYAQGLLDFAALHEGREVHLCWRLGEETIAHWHEVDADFAGRQPVELLSE